MEYEEFRSKYEVIPSSKAARNIQGAQYIQGTQFNPIGNGQRQTGRIETNGGYFLHTGFNGFTQHTDGNEKVKDCEVYCLTGNAYVINK